MRIILQKNIFVLLLCFCLTAVYAQESEYGIASYYGDEYQGGETASGERYDKKLLTAAHKTLPMGTKVRVTRIDTKKTVDVTINDRGPYFKGRILDLSGKAAEVLGIRKDGTANIKLDVLGKGRAVVAKAKAPVKKTTTDTKTSPPVARPKVTVPKTKPKTTPNTTPKPKEAEVFKPKGRTKPAAKTKTTYVPAKKKTVESSDDFEIVTAKNYHQYGLYKIELTKPKNAMYGVQVASLSSYSNALKQVATLQGKWFKNILLNIEPGMAVNTPNFKVILGPFPDAETAKSYQQHAKKKGVNGFVINLEEE